MIRVVDKSMVKSWESYDMEAARASVVPPEVSFRVDEPAIKKWRHVFVRGLLENAGQAPVCVTIFSGGHGTAGPFGFFVEPSASCATRKPPPPGPPLPLQSPPPPLIIELPAQTAIRIESSIAFGDYNWIAKTHMVIEWAFHFWNEPKPRGTVIVP